MKSPQFVYFASVEWMGRKTYRGVFASKVEAVAAARKQLMRGIVWRSVTRGRRWTGTIGGTRVGELTRMKTGLLDAGW